MFATNLAVVATKSSLERATRIELAFSAWEADVLPLNYARAVPMVLPGAAVDSLFVTMADMSRVVNHGVS
jgi:hypothetical protein